MITLSEADDLHEIIRNVAREQGRDMTNMHAIADEVLGMPVGDSTPPPGTLIVEPALVFPAPLHEGPNEPPEGKFYLPPFHQPTTLPRQVKRLSRKLSRLTYFVAGFAMCSLSFAFVVWYRW